MVSQNPPGWTPPPFDPRRIARMIQNRLIMRADRSTSLVAVVYVPGGGVEYLLVSNAVFRWHNQSDQTTLLTAGSAQIDALAELPLVDPVSHVAYDGLKFAYLALTSTATAAAVAVAERYEVLAYKRAGLTVNRLKVYCRRLR